MTDTATTDAFSSEQPGLFACAALGIAVSGERAGQPLLRVVAGRASSELSHSSSSKTEEQPVAEALGVSVYAKQLVHAHDRAQLQRLCRYVLRPPLSQERLALRDDGRHTLKLKNVRKDGTRALLLEPQDLLVRLCAAVPPPWFNLVRYFGVLSSHSRERAEVCPNAPAPQGRFGSEPAAGDQLTLDGLFAKGEETKEPCSGRSRVRDVFAVESARGPRPRLEIDWRQSLERRSIDRYGVAERLRAYLREAGVTRSQLFESSDARIALRAHDLRATFVTLSLSEGQSEAWIVDRTGHKSSQMIYRYRRAARTHAELGLGPLAPLDDAIPELR